METSCIHGHVVILSKTWVMVSSELQSMKVCFGFAAYEERKIREFRVTS